MRRKNHGYQVKKKECRKFIQGKKEIDTKDNKPGLSRNYLLFYSKLAFTWLYSSLPRKESRKAWNFYLEWTFRVKSWNRRWNRDFMRFHPILTILPDFNPILSISEFFEWFCTLSLYWLVKSYDFTSWIAILTTLLGMSIFFKNIFYLKVYWKNILFIF